MVVRFLFVRNVMNHALTAGAWLLIACIWGGAERDESRPYGWRMVAGCVFLLARNVINHAPTAGAWHLNNR